MREANTAKPRLPGPECRRHAAKMKPSTPPVDRPRRAPPTPAAPAHHRAGAAAAAPDRVPRRPTVRALRRTPLKGEGRSVFLRGRGDQVPDGSCELAYFPRMADSCCGDFGQSRTRSSNGGGMRANGDLAYLLARPTRPCRGARLAVPRPAFPLLPRVGQARGHKNRSFKASDADASPDSRSPQCVRSLVVGREISGSQIAVFEWDLSNRHHCCAVVTNRR